MNHIARTLGAMSLQFFRQSVIQSACAAAASSGKLIPTPNAAPKAVARIDLRLTVLTFSDFAQSCEDCRAALLLVENASATVIEKNSTGILNTFIVSSNLQVLIGFRVIGRRWSLIDEPITSNTTISSRKSGQLITAQLLMSEWMNNVSIDGTHASREKSCFRHEMTSPKYF